MKRNKRESILIKLAVCLVIFLIGYTIHLFTWSPKQDGVVNFDNYFKYTEVEAGSGIEPLQAAIDKNYMTKYSNVFYHHATDLMLDCMHSLEPGDKVIINNNTYTVRELLYVEHVNEKIDWVYNDVIKVMCCAGSDKDLCARWVLIIE